MFFFWKLYMGILQKETKVETQREQILRYSTQTKGITPVNSSN